MISIIIPIYPMKNGAELFWRCINSIMEQTFKDYEIVITRDGKMAENTNSGIKRSRGDLIKILYMDDYLAHKHALEVIVGAFEANKTAQWLITGVDNNTIPYWTDDIETGNNKLGSPSALTIRNDNPLLFDENMGFLLDCDYYKRMYKDFGSPIILNGVHVIMGIHDGQATNLMTDEEKQKELEYIINKYK